MPHAAQALYQQNLEVFRASRDPYGLSALLRTIREEPRPDPEFDALLDTLADAIPADAEPAPARPLMPLDWLDAGPDEAPAPAPDNDNAASAPVPEVVTKAPARARRKKTRSALRQREDARDMRAAARVRVGEVVDHLHPTSTPASTPSRSPTPTSLPTSTKTTPNADNDNAGASTSKAKTGRGRLIASWDNAGDLPRLIAVNRGLDRFGVPHAFSLNISPDLIQAGNDNARGLLDHMRRRIALTLKRTLGEAPPMWVAIETDDDGRPHLHGGIALTDQHDPAVILGGIAKAGGNWTRQGSAPADLRRQHDPDGWAAYPLKRAPRTRRDLREAAGLSPDARISLYAVSADLLVEGKRRHEDARRIVGRR